MRFVLYAVKLPRNLVLLFAERVFVTGNGAVCDTPERSASKIRCKGDTKLSDFANRRHEAIKNQMLYGGLR